MGKSIYTYYKERLIEIGGSNRCLFLRGIVRRGAYDIGRILEGRDGKIAEFVDFLFGASKKYSFTLLSRSEKEEILRNTESQRRRAKTNIPAESDAFESDPEAVKKAERARAQEATKALEGEITRVKELRRETDEIMRETGRYELYIGYPFVFGCIQQGSTKTLVKAPLLLFPVNVEIGDDSSVEIRLSKEEKVHINHALVFAYAQAKKLNIDALELEYDNISSSFRSVKEVVDYLRSAGIKIEGNLPKNILNYSRFKEPDAKPELSIRNACVMARFPLSNSIYSDYSVLEKKNLTNDALTELLRIGKPKRRPWWSFLGEPKKKVESSCYNVKMLDFAQSEVVRKVEENGNMVIYGPPGTGKSQTIVNIIADAMAKGKRVLVVSQKKAALDVVYNRLGLLCEKAMYITDEAKEKRSFYDRCFRAHNRDLEEAVLDISQLEAEYRELEEKIAKEQKKLEDIHLTLTSPRMPFGLSLSEMYSSSYNLQKNSYEYTVYEVLIHHPDILSLTYKELSEAMFGICEMKLGDMYYDFMQAKEKNPLIDNMLPDLDLRTLGEVKGKLEEIQRSKKGLFNTSKYPYCRQVLAFYSLLRDEDSLDRIVRLEADFKKPGFFKRTRVEEEIKASFLDTLDAIEMFVKEYDCLRSVLTEDGYISVIDNILRGNVSYIKLVYEALDNYIAFRDVSLLLESLDTNKLGILNFAYTTCKNRSSYNDIIAKLPTIRIYHEILACERSCRDELSMLMDFENITEKIYKLKEEQLDIARRICSSKNSKEYEALYESAKNNKDYLYQISKKQKYWPIRKTMEVYSDFILSLFPCWLLSPENVSSLLPLVKNLFDIVVFDEASQVFIENTIPTIYRGKTVVVAGDDKQLRPSATFMKRYLGADPDTQEDYAVQAALEVDSLLDLAVARYESANLSYHYRSRYQELIDFSNAAFYASSLQIAPNISPDGELRPIIRYKVKGKWIDRKNISEAKKVVELLSEIFEQRKNNESIGIITFNAEQQSAIADMIDAECAKNPEFRSKIILEKNRMENGEDTSLFIKNLENVQGDERDIIIFSIGYAENESGKVHTSFGSLSAEGGENRLNVAITRAKSRIYVVTSIEPEELKVESSKNKGPKLLQKYLQYVRAVSNGNKDEVRAILGELAPEETKVASLALPPLEIEEEIKSRLEKLGYRVDTRLGNRKNRISLAVYDDETDRYLVGIELDRDAFLASEFAMERDVYKPRFLAARGWKIMRVWCRDFWLSPSRVVKSIAAVAEKEKKRLK